jgi:uncharacterized protein (DUF427 family)
MPEMKIPGPDHPITVSAKTARVQVTYNGHVIVDSRRALELKEAAYKPVLYFPRDDVDMAYFSRTDHHTYCPYKGEASYYTILMDGRFAENAVWTYETPYPAMAEIKDLVAFYPNQVEIHEIAEEDTGSIRDAVEHTDAGDGRSQKDHWPPNAPNPA